MHLLDLTHAGEQRRLHADLALEIVQIPYRLAAITRDHLVAGAVIANGIAKRNMQINRQCASRAHLATMRHRFQVGIGAELIGKTISRRIRRIARTELAHFAQQALAHLQLRRWQVLHVRNGHSAAPMPLTQAKNFDLQRLSDRSAKRVDMDQGCTAQTGIITAQWQCLRRKK